MALYAMLLPLVLLSFREGVKERKRSLSADKSSIGLHHKAFTIKLDARYLDMVRKDMRSMDTLYDGTT